MQALPDLDPPVQYAVLEALRTTVLFLVRHSIDADSLVSEQTSSNRCAFCFAPCHPRGPRSPWLCATSEVASPCMCPFYPLCDCVSIRLFMGSSLAQEPVDASMMPLLVQLLRSPDSGVCRAAVSALYGIHILPSCHEPAPLAARPQNTTF